MRVRRALNYAIDKQNYDELVQRRESLKISDEASQTTDGGVDP